MTAEEIAELLEPVFQKYKDDLVFCYLFGSAVQNKLGPLSDIDVAAFLQERTKEEHFRTRLSLHADLCRALKRDTVDLIMLNNVTNLMLLDEIVRGGLVLVDSNRGMRMEFECRVLHRVLDFKSQRTAIMGV